jgi:heat shock protein HslJ
LKEKRRVDKEQYKTITMKTNNIIQVVAAIFIVLILSGCSGSKEKVTITPLIGTEWKLETFNGKTVSLNSGNYITLNFAATSDKISGAGVCNKYFGEFTKSGDAIKFSGIGSTKMMCDDNINESDYFNALGKVDAYKISDGKLSLISNSSVIAVFKM